MATAKEVRHSVPSSARGPVTDCATRTRNPMRQVLLRYCSGLRAVVLECSDNETKIRATCFPRRAWGARCTTPTNSASCCPLGTNSLSDNDCHGSCTMRGRDRRVVRRACHVTSTVQQLNLRRCSRRPPIARRVLIRRRLDGAHDSAQLLPHPRNRPQLTPSFFIRERSVCGLISSSSAAPPLPSMRPLVSSRARSMCLAIA
ncbi:MAG: hypothetical protein JWN48_460 [Myxococcaceae bacterium]|nr:hypothetical protein [Myxococcaceae bacterium]